MAYIDNSGGGGVGGASSSVRLPSPRVGSAREDSAGGARSGVDVDGTEGGRAAVRAERDILSLSPAATARQSRLESADFDRSIDEERAGLLVLQLQQSIAERSSGPLTGSDSESRRLISFLR